MVERQGGYDGFLALDEDMVKPQPRLLEIGQQGPMGQHGALGYAGRAAGILQKRQVVAIDVYRIECQGRSSGQDRSERDGVGDVPGRHHPLDALDDEIDEQAFGKAEQVAELGGDHMFDRRLIADLGEGRGEVLDDDDGFGPGVRELMFELARRIKRVAVDDHVAGAERTEKRNRILQHVRHHQRDARALGQAKVLLQIGRKSAGQRVELGIAERSAHVDEGDFAREASGGALEKLTDGAIVPKVY